MSGLFGDINAHDFMGKNGFIWWIGIVEDRNDPLNLGRARVRILGFHNEETDKLATKDLPWALSLAPLANPSSPKSPPDGSWVLGFFLDGLLAQQPVMLGVLPGYRSQEDMRVEAEGTHFTKLPT
jgi:hypothetical protein